MPAALRLPKRLVSNYALWVSLTWPHRPEAWYMQTCMCSRSCLWLPHTSAPMTMSDWPCLSQGLKRCPVAAPFVISTAPAWSRQAYRQRASVREQFNQDHQCPWHPPKQTKFLHVLRWLQCKGLVTQQSPLAGVPQASHPATKVNGLWISYFFALAKYLAKTAQERKGLFWLPVERGAVHYGRNEFRGAGTCSIACGILEPWDAKSLRQKTEAQCNLLKPTPWPRSFSSKTPSPKGSVTSPNSSTIWDEEFKLTSLHPQIHTIAPHPRPQYISMQDSEQTLADSIGSRGQK